MDSHSSSVNPPTDPRGVTALVVHESAFRELLTLLRSAPLAITNIDLRTNEIHWFDLIFNPGH